MSIQHLSYCTQEIVNASEFLKISNSDFYKRAVTRIIAIRTDDFIKIGFKVNKATIKNQQIKNELNALKDIYTNYFKLHRDKYSAHFQDLDLTIRLETWSNIDLTRANFFSSIPIEIYQMFAPVDEFTQLVNSCLSINLGEIEELNNQYNFEKYPNISSDILALTRPNTGGIIHFSGLQTKAGVLKSIELLVDYELELFKRYRNDPCLGEIFAKLFIADLTSYADNFITRSEIASTALQYEHALDYFISQANMVEHIHIMNGFKTNYKFEIIRSELRLVRNTVAGHIDLTLSVTDIQNIIQNFDLEKFEAFYNQIKNTFRKMCYTGMLLRTFAFSPYDKLHGTTKIFGFDIKAFDGGREKETEILLLDKNDEKEYENQLFSWLKENNSEARSFFWDCCCNSTVVDKKSEELLLVNNQTLIVHYEIRKAHIFLEEKLLDKSISITDKTQIVGLFISLKSGFPDTLAHILIRTYPNDKTLRKVYVNGIGQLLSKPIKFVFDLINELMLSNDFFDLYEGLLALYRIDLKFRFHNRGKHLQEETSFSIYLKEKLQSNRRPWANLIYNLALAGEYVYGLNHTGNTCQVTYYLVFEKNIISLLRKIMVPLISSQKDKRSLRSIETAFYNKRFATFIALIGDFLDKHKHNVTAKNFYTVLRGGYVEFAKNDPDELHNYAVASLRRGDLTEAILIAKFLVKDHSYTHKYYYFLLSLYLTNEQYKEEFIQTKFYVLNNFNLIGKEHQDILKLKYKLR